jgi:hypothetical protein
MFHKQHRNPERKKNEAVILNAKNEVVILSAVEGPAFVLRRI